MGLELLLTSFLGPLFGLVGTWFTGKTENARKQMDVNAQLELSADNVELAKLELEKIKLLGADALDKQNANEDYLLRLEAAKSEATSPLFPSAKGEHWFVKFMFAYADVISRLIRPHLTIAFAVLQIWLTVMAFQYVGNLKIMETYSGQIIHSSIVLAEALITWWFGIRMSEWAKKHN